MSYIMTTAMMKSLTTLKSLCFTVLSSLPPNFWKLHHRLVHLFFFNVVLTFSGCCIMDSWQVALFRLDFIFLLNIIHSSIIYIWINDYWLLSNHCIMLCCMNMPPSYQITFGKHFIEANLIYSEGSCSKHFMQDFIYQYYLTFIFVLLFLKKDLQLEEILKCHYN